MFVVTVLRRRHRALEASSRLLRRAWRRATTALDYTTRRALTVGGPVAASAFDAAESIMLDFCCRRVVMMSMALARAAAARRRVENHGPTLASAGQRWRSALLQACPSSWRAFPVTRQMAHRAARN